MSNNTPTTLTVLDLVADPDGTIDTLAAQARARIELWAEITLALHARGIMSHNAIHGAAMLAPQVCVLPANYAAMVEVGDLFSMERTLTEHAGSIIVRYSGGGLEMFSFVGRDHAAWPEIRRAFLRTELGTDEAAA